jgi:hypothetical protein
MADLLKGSGRLEVSPTRFELSFTSADLSLTSTLPVHFARARQMIQDGGMGYLSPQRGDAVFAGGIDLDAAVACRPDVDAEGRAQHHAANVARLDLVGGKTQLPRGRR